MNQSMEVFARYKIRVIKEEGNMSHVNQVYDQEVAVKDKASMRNYNSVIRTSCSSVNVLDQWHLVSGTALPAQPRVHAGGDSNPHCCR